MLSNIFLFRLTSCIVEVIRVIVDLDVDGSTTEHTFCVRQTLEEKWECNGLEH
jgi:hypothetical protein